MSIFAVIEVEDGLTVIEVQPGETPEEAAINAGGALIDPGPFTTIEEATSALDLLEADSHEDS